MAVPLLIVADEVFDAGHHPLRLHPLDIGRSGFGRQIGILTVIFEITAAQRRAIDIHARTEQDMHAARTTVLPQRTAVVAHQRAIPRRRGRNPAREHRAAGIVAHTLRAVGHTDLGNTQSGNRTDIEGVETADIVEFLVERHLADERLGTGFVFFGDLLRRRRKQGSDRQQPSKKSLHWVQNFSVQK